MKIAIHKRKNSYSDKWIKYCQANNIPFKIVNCYDNDITKQLSDCDGLMWHWDLNDYKATLFVKQLTISLEKINLKVFPSVNTSWHYDDKVGQKYLLEAIDAPIVPTHVFYSKTEALEWVESAKFPLVFKLRCGASSINVRLVRNFRKAKKLIRIAFDQGFASTNRFEKIKSRIVNLVRSINFENFIALIKSILRIFIPTEVEKFSLRQKGYVYFQDFIPNNSFDTRIEVIGNRCTAVRRYNRKNDFRASGSGDWSFERELFDPEMIKLAFEIAEKLNLQSVAFDFIVDKDQYKLVEMSYCWPTEGSELYSGYWDRNLNWHEGNVTSENFMISDFISKIAKSK